MRPARVSQPPLRKPPLPPLPPVSGTSRAFSSIGLPSRSSASVTVSPGCLSVSESVSRAPAVSGTPSGLRGGGVVPHLGDNEVAAGVRADVHAEVAGLAGDERARLAEGGGDRLFDRAVARQVDHSGRLVRRLLLGAGGRERQQPPG